MREAKLPHPIDLNLDTAEESLMEESDHAERTRERLLMQEESAD